MAQNNNNNKNSIWKKARETHWSWNDTQVNSALRVTGLILLSLLSIFVLVKTMGEVKAFSTIGETPTSPYMISVSGRGEVAGVKDIASLSFSSNGKGKTAVEAQAKAAEANNKALAFLKSKGVADKDISTQSYNTYPTYDQKVRPCMVESVSTSGYSAGVRADSDVVYGPIPESMPPAEGIKIAPIMPCNNIDSVISGYETNQYIEIKIRNIDKNPALSGEIITGLAEAGVQVGSLQNSIDNVDSLKSDARRIAIAKAHAEAKDIAKALGGRLGKVVSFNEDYGGYPMVEQSMRMDAKAMNGAMPPEIPAGEGKVTSNVTVTYEIK